MKSLAHFSIPIHGMKSGVHNLTFKMDTSTFELFDYGLLNKGEFEIEVTLEKFANHIAFSFFAKGDMEGSCDRCTANIHLPMSAEENYIIKFGETQSIEDNVITIVATDHEFNVAHYVYEALCLKVPMVKLIDCENQVTKPCDFKTLEFLEQETENEPTNSVWDSLKEIKFKK